MGGTEFLTGHEEDEGGVGEGCDGLAVDEVGGERGDAVVFEEGAAGWVGEARDREDSAWRGACGGGGAGEHEGERAAHFAAGTGDEEITLVALECFDGAVGGTGEELVELSGIAGEGGRHGGSGRERCRRESGEERADQTGSGTGVARGGEDGGGVGLGESSMIGGIGAGFGVVGGSVGGAEGSGV